MSFKELYNQSRIELKKELELSSIEQVPKITKVTINIGTGQAVKDSNYLDKVSSDLTLITGQKPKICKARKSIAGFKLREGMSIGLSTTLRGKRMYDFINKLVNIALPRVRDFQGLSPKSFDGKGNYTIGLKEHVVFPEVTIDNVEKTFGMAITITTNKLDDELTKALLTKLNFPFKKK